MANASDMNKDQFIRDYEKQRQSFIEGLKRFNSNKGTPFHRLPEISGQEIDLYHLYQRVTSYGGWQKVNNEEKWSKMLPDFGIPKSCTNAHEALKHIYFRYLNNYEKVNFLGEDIDLRKNEDEDGPTRKKICLPIESVPLSYNYNQHKLSDAQRQQLNLPAETLKKGPYEKLELSLHSGLPNEVDMAINVCVLLSTEGRHTTNLQKANNLLPLLLAHVGIFGHDELKLENLYSSCWLRNSKRDFLRFWYESVRKKDIRMLITWKGHIYTQKEMVGEDVLNMGRDLGVLDSEGQRVTQLAVLLRNLSFEDCNQKTMASSRAVFKFLLLCLHNTYGSLRQLALDTLANLSHEIVLGTVESLTSQLMINIIHEAMISEDRFHLVRGLEVLSKICQLVDNRDILSTELNNDVYTRLIDLLTLQDIQIIVHTLEALYKLSKVGEPFTTKIARVHKAIEILVSLITIEAQSFGPGSLVGIKVVEYVPPVQASEDGGEVLKRPTTVIQPVNPDSVNIYQVPGSQGGQLNSSKSTQSSIHGSKDGGPLNQPKAKEPVTDIQATTSSWLKATFEAKKKSKVNQVELFSDYLQFCRKFGIKNTLSSAEFLQMVKTIFQQVDVVSINRKNGDRDVFFEGLCKRQQQRPFVVTTMPSERVAKAVNVNVSPQQIPPHVVTPTLRQRLMEPPRLSSPHQLPHSPGSVTPSSARAPTNAPHHQASASKPGTPVLVTRKVAKVIIPPPTPSAKAKKRDVDSNVITPLQKSGSAIPQMTNMSSSSYIPDDGSPSHLNPNGTVIESSSSSSSFSYNSSSHEEASDPSCVKSLLARKLCQTNTDSSSEPAPLGKSSMCLPVPTSIATPISSVIMTKPLHKGSASLSPASSIMACPAVTSSQMNPGYRPVYQQGKSTVVTSESWSPQVAFPLPSLSTSQSQNQPTLSSASSIPLHISQSSAIQTSHPNQQSSSSELSTHNHINQSSTSTAVVNQESNRDVVSSNCNAQKPNQSISQIVNTTSGTGILSVVSAPQSVTNFPNAQQCVNVSMIQPTNSSTPILSQQQTVNVQVVQQQTQNVQQVANNNSLTQPNTNMAFVQQRQNIPVIPQPSIQPSMSVSNPVLSMQGSSTLVVGPRPTTAFVQHQQPCSMTSPSSITLNHLIRTPSSVQIASQSLGNAPSAASIAGPQQCTTVTQSISSPAVAALLTSNPQQASPMLISAPVQGASRPSIGVPSTVVIQTPPGTIVMPSRQLLLQGGVGAVQQQNQTQQGTVSFVMPPNYRQTSSLIIQQTGSVNMLPSLTLQTQQPLASSLTSQTGQIAGQLGTRQIVINQSSLPMGMQIASMTGNTANICVAPQPQNQPNLVIQSVPAQSNQLQNHLPTMSSNHLPAINGPTIHMPQVAGHESQLSRSDTVSAQQNQAQQQNCHSSVVASQPMQNPQFVVQVSQTQQQSQQQQQQQQSYSTPVVTTSQAQYSSQTVHCNGNIPEVNGVLGSPDSISSDFPPSPLSTGGILNDKDIPNGKHTDTDNETSSLKANLVKYVEKAAKSKVNGFVHVIENGCHSFDQPKTTLTSTASTNTQIHNTPVVGRGNEIPNGCTSDSLHHTGDSQRSQNIQGRFVVSNGTSGGPAVQNKQSAAHPDGQMAQPRFRQQFQSKPTASSQSKAPQQQIATAEAGKLSRPQTRISTLNCPASVSSGTNTVNRPPVFRSNSDDSDLSNDSASDAGDKAQKSRLKSPAVSSKKKKPNEVTIPQPVALSHRLRKKTGPAEKTILAVHGDGKKQVSIVLEYRCEWGSCRRCFATSRLVFLHVFKHHIPQTPESCCQWLSCETMVRKRWSLVSHVQDYHCSEMAMRNACQRRYTAAQNPSGPPPPMPPLPMVYPPDAAIQAIRRFAIKPPYQEFAEQREGPVSKHIRLTAALILRNICHHSALGRRLISRHEQHLTFNTMNAVESSSALSSCLWDIIHFGESSHKSSSTASHLE